MKKLLQSQKGFTLVEILIVIGLIGIIGAVIYRNIGGQSTAGKSKLARTEMKLLLNNLETFSLSCGRYPTPEEGLESLIKLPDTCDNPGLNILGRKTVPKAPTGGEYKFEIKEDGTPKLSTVLPGKEQKVLSSDEEN